MIFGWWCTKEWRVMCTAYFLFSFCPLWWFCFLREKTWLSSVVGASIIPFQFFSFFFLHPIVYLFIYLFIFILLLCYFKNIIGNSLINILHCMSEWMCLRWILLWMIVTTKFKQNLCKQEKDFVYFASIPLIISL